MKPGELVEAIRVPTMASSARFGYVKSCRKTGEFAHAMSAVLIDPDAGTARVVIGALQTAPMLLDRPMELFGGRLTGEFSRTFDARVADALLMKAGISDAVDRHIHVSVLRRAIAEASQ